MLERNSWINLLRKLDWQTLDRSADALFPDVVSGKSPCPIADWHQWDEPYKTTFFEYVKGQHKKEDEVEAVFESVTRLHSSEQLSSQWLSAAKLHGALLPLAEFAAVVGNLRAARFGRDTAWRNMALLGALDELRHTQIPLRLNHALVKHDSQFDWTQKFYRTNNWIAIAARHFFDELLLTSNPIEFAIATNFVFETGFTNLQFIGLSAFASAVGDPMFEEMITSIQTDEARHSQIGGAVLDIVQKSDPAYVQAMVDKWFWRSWRLFSIATGFAMDYFTPVEKRTASFKEFMEEWIIDQFLSMLAVYKLEKPWYWNIFLQELEYYHHMVYASAYTYRATAWFDFVVPGPSDQAWLAQKYPESWPSVKPVWDTIIRTWENTEVGFEFGVHGSAIIGFCHLCQVVLCGGTPQHNSAIVERDGPVTRIFCSTPCQAIFNADKGRYAVHKDLVTRVLVGEAPGNLMAMLQQYMGLSYDEWGKDCVGGDYPWMKRRTTEL